MIVSICSHMLGTALKSIQDWDKELSDDDDDDDEIDKITPARKRMKA